MASALDVFPLLVVSDGACCALSDGELSDECVGFCCVLHVYMYVCLFVVCCPQIGRGMEKSLYK